MQVDNGIKGIDVSHFQGNIDWAQVKASGIQFAYVKASEGATYTDPSFALFVAQAKAHGIPVGAYHFARFNQTSATDEANHFIQLYKANPTDLRPMLDLEAPSSPDKLMDVNALIQSVRTWVNLVEQATGKKPILYTGKWFADEYQDFNNALADLDLWVADYARDVMPDFGGWSTCIMHQYASDGKVPGIPNDVDMDLAVSLQAIGYNPAPQHSLSADLSNYVISRFIGHEYDYASPEDKLLRAYIGDALRIASGQTPHNADMLHGYTPVFK